MHPERLPLPRVLLGAWPTPVERLDALSTAASTLWVKHDDASHALYGGNKVRKLEYLIGEARARGASRILTIGAAGSHHVLATVLHGRNAGLRVAAVLVAQPVTPGVTNNLRAGLAAGLEPYPAESYAGVPRAVARAWKRGDYLVPPGGSSVAGSAGYIDAAAEIAEAVRTRSIPDPDAIVVALGSGGTAAGLLVGAIQHGLRATIVGVHVVDPAVTSTASAMLLARRLAARVGVPTTGLTRRFETDSSKLGKGYGHETVWGDRAIERAARCGLRLDATYTAKAFAHALELVEKGTYRNVLYVHTLSSAPMEALLEGAPDLPDDLRALVRSVNDAV
jgi:1-aminocyclopropane-1-carboxylate deaminase/D-cysteine desulfhydrase-like pyridoxal-dependent ACC family enzyme